MVVEEGADEERLAPNPLLEGPVGQVVQPIEDDVGTGDPLVCGRQGVDSSDAVASSEKWASRKKTSASPVAPPPFMVLSERISWSST